MKKIGAPGYTSLLLFVITACSSNSDPAALEPAEAAEKNHYQVQKDISYGADKAQILDLYLPSNRSSAITKVLVFIHGGGWIQGDKKDMREYIPLLQKRHPNHAIANLNYRLAVPGSEPAFPNQFLDLKKAIKHLSEKGREYGIKAEYGLIGASAGGHLALQYDSVYDTGDQVKLVCSIVGPSNLIDSFYTENSDFDVALGYLVDEDAYP